MRAAGQIRGAALRRWLPRVLALGFGILASVVALELGLRATGASPWRTLLPLDNEPRVLVPDPVLGWRPAPGRHVFAPYVPHGAEAYVTVRTDGSRWAGAHAANDATLLLVGCSFTQGWAVSDDETFAWHLQARVPELQVVNRGVAAYGTYQSLMVMERALAGPNPPQTIVYGMMEEHEARNVAAAAWLMLLASAARRDVVAVPHATLDDDGRLVRHPPVEYPRWPLREQSALVAAAERRWVEWQARERTAQQRAVTAQLLLEMARTAAAHGARFAVALLHFSPAAKAHYAALLREHGIEVVDCAFRLTADLRVPGDPHPNGLMHARYAECLAQGLGLGGMREAVLPPAPEGPEVRSSDPA